MDRIAEASPRLRARLAGVFYLTTGGTAFAEFVRDRVFVPGDAAGTGHNILASESLYRWGFAADLLGLASYVVVTLLLYGLLKPVNKSLSLLAAFFSLMGIAVQAVSSLGHFAPLLLLGGAHYLAAFDAAQLQAMALVSLKLHALGFNVGLVFFGFYCTLLGYLIFGSTFFPRTIGVMMAIAGFGYLTNSFLIFLAPALASQLPPFIFVTGLGELALMLWLLVMGVDVAKWEAKANRLASQH
jgi:hypothetical protein